MNRKKNLGILYRYELIKILKNKVAILTFLILFAYTFIQGEFEIRGNVDLSEWEMYKTLNDRVIDNTLLSELVSVSDGSGHIINDNNKAYEDLGYLVQDITGYGVSYDDLDESTLYAAREKTIAEAHELAHLTKEEELFWQERENTLGKPFVYHDTVITSGILEGISNYMIMLLIIIATGLSSVFAMETQRKTDPMIRASLNGCKELYFAKVLAGMSYIIVCTLTLLSTYYLYIGIRWGLDGISSPIQIYRPYSQMNLSVVQLSGILIMLTLSGSALISSFALFISNTTRNSLASMAVIIGTHLALFALPTMIPYSLRTLSQFLSLLPATLVSSRLVYEFRLVRLGRFLYCYQAAPMLYLILTAIFTIAGYSVYKRHEIRSN